MTSSNSSLRQPRRNLNNGNKTNRTKSDYNLNTPNNETNKNETNNSNYSETKKLPHPPPSTRPAVSSARKARLSTKSAQNKSNGKLKEKKKRSQT